jgi:hypothetical protein
VGVRTFPQMFCYSSQNSCTYTLLPIVWNQIMDQHCCM